MRRNLLDYDLPQELIASRPPPERDGARLLVLGDSVAHDHVRRLASLLPEGALLVVNDTRVVPARLLGRKRGSGGKAEIFLVERVGAEVVRLDGVDHPGVRHRAMGRSSKPLREGAVIEVGDDLRCVVVSNSQGEGDALLGVVLVTRSGRPVEQVVEEVGHMPLPPYMRREDEAFDRERYQTVFADRPGAVAAPTAGLHISERVLADLDAAKVEVARVTLHVGLGTFQPVTADDLDDHPMHMERYEVSEATARAIDRARDRGAKVVAVGTTVVRALESAAAPEAPGRVRAMAGETRLLIQPGYRFRVVDALLTNFHLPQSTLLALVCAFAGTERVLAAYDCAIAERYRFYSYGDAMFAHRREPA